ncbi:MAG: hypothetical protein ACEQSB_00185 [Undibacterium sp.]
MMLYRWNSRALAQFSDGFMIAVGATEEEARAKLLAAFEDFYIADRFFGGKYPTHDDDIEDLKEAILKTRVDLAGKPEKISKTLFIHGSE